MPDPPPPDRLLAALAAVAADGPADAPPAERYERLEEVGRGGVGRVWRAWDRHLGREVALKEPRPDRPAGPVLAAEVAVLARLQHPNVVPLLDAAPDRTSFYTMPLLPGDTLRQAAVTFHAAGPADGLAFRRLVAAFQGVCRGVAHAHGRGVRHLDLKGANVRLGPLGEAVVVDWGLAATGSVGGTPGYQSPEQAAAGGAVDDRTDVYGLGAVLYELLTGRPPHAAPTATGTARLAAYADPLPPRAYWPGVLPPLASVCAKAMARRPADRYATADELLAEVEAWAADRRVLAHPERARERAARFVRRHQRPAAALAVGLVLAVVALAAGLWRAEVALAAEQDSFRLAFEVGRDGFVSSTDPRLTQADGLHGLRLELARRGLTHFRELQARYPHNVGVRQAVAVSQLRIGLLTSEVGRLADAEAEFRTALPQLEALAAGPAATRTDRLALIEGRVMLATVLARSGGRRESVESAARAEDDCRAWLPDGDVDRLRLMMVAANARGLAAPTPAEAEAAFTAGAELADRLVATRPDGHEFRGWRGLMRLQTAIQQQEQGNTPAARDTLARARAEYDALGAEQDWPTGVRQRVAACENMAGLVETDDGHYPEAVARLTRAVAHRRELVSRNPDSLQMRSELATSLSNLGRALLLAGQPRAAADPAREGVALCEAVHAADPSREHLRFYAGRFRTRAGLVAVALGEWDRAAADLDAAGRLLAAPMPPAYLRHAAERAGWAALVHAVRGRWVEVVAEIVRFTRAIAG